jgi:hypothetical protein
MKKETEQCLGVAVQKPPHATLPCADRVGWPSPPIPINTGGEPGKKKRHENTEKEKKTGEKIEKRKQGTTERKKKGKEKGGGR